MHIEDTHSGALANDTSRSTGDRRQRGPSPWIRIRWAAIGAAVAVSLGAGGIGLVSAGVSSGERAVFVAIEPCRVLDVRPNTQVGLKASPFGPGETVEVEGRGDSGQCTGLPADATALSLNITALNATERTFLTVFAAGGERPDASSLNPSPGAPPTPNAVVAQLSTDGEFAIFNRAGSVDVFVDVNGYYIDHDHDDRYDTSAEVDAKVAAGVAAAAAAGPTDIGVGPFDFSPQEEGSNWTASLGLSHASSATEECIVAPIDARVGQSVTELELSYVTASSPTIQLSVGGTRITPGPVPGGSADLLHSIADETLALTPSTPGELAAATAALTADVVVRDGFRYVATVCTNDSIVVFGAQITLTNP
ncbi:MAG: hypothetical protein AB8G14_03145 [Ilumatobacter sp.]